VGDIQASLGQADVLSLLDRTIGFLAPGDDPLTYVVREAGLAVTIYPDGGIPSTAPGPAWPAYAIALLGEKPQPGIRPLLVLTEILDRHGSLPVPRIVHFGEGTGPNGRDFATAEILPGRPFDGERFRMGKRAARQLGEHLGRIHKATARIDGFGAFGEAPTRWNRWWSRFALSYSVLADVVCDASPAPRGFRRRIDAALDRATRSPDPRDFTLVCVDQNPSRYLGDTHGTISGLAGVQGHLWAPAEWELSAILLWMPSPRAFREGYERYRCWPERMDETRDAYATYTLLKRWRRALERKEPPGEFAEIEARMIETLA